MTAWEELIRGSTLTVGTAWDHITHQAGGTGGGKTIVVEAMAASVSALMLNMDVDDAPTSAAILSSVLDSNVASLVLAGTITSLGLAASVQNAETRANVLEEVV